MRAPDILWLPLLAALAAPAAGQQARRVEAPARPESVQVAEPKLVFEREVFQYSGGSRRDPFRPLTSTSEGPLFTDLSLRMILHSEDPRSSVVALSDAANRHYRLRRGESVGNATITDIGPRHVVFSVLDFGLRRQEVLELKEPGRERSR
jgi:hypothetical protein